jgi:hypothetical protein
MAKGDLAEITPLILGGGALYVLFQSGILQNLGQGASNALSGVGGGVAATGAGLGSGLAGLGNGVGGGVFGLGQGIGSGINNLGGGLNQVGTGLSNLLTQLGGIGIHYNAQTGNFDLGGGANTPPAAVAPPNTQQSTPNPPPANGFWTPQGFEVGSPNQTWNTGQISTPTPLLHIQPVAAIPAMVANPSIVNKGASAAANIVRQSMMPASGGVYSSNQLLGIYN